MELDLEITTLLCLHDILFKKTALGGFNPTNSVFEGTNAPIPNISSVGLRGLVPVVLKAGCNKIFGQQSKLINSSRERGDRRPVSSDRSGSFHTGEGFFCSYLGGYLMGQLVHFPD